MKNSLYILIISSLAIFFTNCNEIYYGSPSINQHLNSYTPSNYFDTTYTPKIYGQAAASKAYAYHEDDQNLAGNLNLTVATRSKYFSMSGNLSMLYGRYLVNNTIIPNYLHNTYNYNAINLRGLLGLYIYETKDTEVNLYSLIGLNTDNGEYWQLMNAIDTISTVQIGSNKNKTHTTFASGIDFSFRSKDDTVLGLNTNLGYNFGYPSITTNFQVYLRSRQHIFNFNYTFEHFANAAISYLEIFKYYFIHPTVACPVVIPKQRGKPPLDEGIKAK